MLTRILYRLYWLSGLIQFRNRHLAHCWAERSTRPHLREPIPAWLIAIFVTAACAAFGCWLA